MKTKAIEMSPKDLMTVNDVIIQIIQRWNQLQNFHCSFLCLSVYRLNMGKELRILSLSVTNVPPENSAKESRH